MEMVARLGSSLRFRQISFLTLRKKIYMENIEDIGKELRKIRELADNNFSKNKLYTDLLVSAVVDRSLKLSRGFSTLLKTKNSQAAAILARSQIDNIARFVGMELFPGQECKYTYYFLNPNKKIIDLTINGNKISDTYLVSHLDKSHPGIKNDYKEYCGYAHLSEKHFKAHSIVISEDERCIEYSTSFSEHDLHLDESSYGRLAQKYLSYLELFNLKLDDYFSKRENILDNCLNVSGVYSQ